MKLLYIGNKLSKHGFSVTNIETLGDQLKELGYKVYFASEYKNKCVRLIDMLLAGFRLRKKVKLVLIDVYSMQAFYFALFSAWMCRIAKVPYIPILHGGNLPARLKNNPVLSKSIFGHSKINVAPSRYLQEAFEQEGFHVEYIPNNIATSTYAFKERNTFHPFLLWVRSFDTIYNPHMAIDVVDGLSKSFPEVKLCMVGPDKDGSMKTCIEYAKMKGLQDNVLIPGKLSKEKWHAISSEYDIFINTTHVDNTPVSVIEAMALGLPVVSTDVGGIPFLIENEKDGVLVADDDAKGMENAIRRIINENDTGSKFVINGRKKAESFDWEVVKEKWTELLDAV